jgi:cytochrome c oxidase subunit III
MPDSTLTHAPQFDDATQQRESATFGMWIFLATEILFFGALFLGYTAYRLAYPAAFAAASRHTLLVFGGTNTAVLLISSATMAFAVRAAREKRRTALVLRLFLTAALGALFLGIKGFEYAREISEHLLPGASFNFAQPYTNHAEMFFYLYFLMTGVHALHLAIGVILIVIFGFRAWRTDAFARNDTAVDLLGLYWHFVDIVWVFLFPLIYLVDRHS